MSYGIQRKRLQHYKMLRSSRLYRNKSAEGRWNYDTRRQIDICKVRRISASITTHVLVQLPENNIRELAEHARP